MAASKHLVIHLTASWMEIKEPAMSSLEADAVNLWFPPSDKRELMFVGQEQVYLHGPSGSQGENAFMLAGVESGEGYKLIMDDNREEGMSKYEFVMVFHTTDLLCMNPMKERENDITLTQLYHKKSQQYICLDQDRYVLKKLSYTSPDKRKVKFTTVHYNESEGSWFFMAKPPQLSSKLFQSIYCSPLFFEFNPMLAAEDEAVTTFSKDIDTLDSSETLNALKKDEDLQNNAVWNQEIWLTMGTDRVIRERNPSSNNN